MVGSDDLVRQKGELQLMRESGRISAKALKLVIESAKPGVTLTQLNQIAEDQILRLGGTPSFKTVPGYSWATCLTVNDEVVHGIPRAIKLKEGDILGIDLGAVYQGWHTDVAWSVLMGAKKEKQSKGKAQFLLVGAKTLEQAIERCVGGNRIGDISSTIQRNIEAAGFSVVRTLVGHGVGRAAHEDPKVPGFGNAGSGLKIKAGMTLAVEVIYTAGSGAVSLGGDGWTIVSADNSLGGLFEMSVIVGQDRPEVLTDWRRF